MPQKCFPAAVPHPRAIACLLMGTLAWASANAQPTSNPTNRQLQAAYCLGVVQEVMKELKEIISLPPPGPPRTLDAILAELKAADEAKYTPPPEQFMEPSRYKAYLNDLLDRAKSLYDSEIKIYAGAENNRSTIQDMEKRRQRLYSYLVTSGALDYLVATPLTPSGIDITKDRGVADQQQCILASNLCPGLSDRVRSNDEMQEANQCFRKTLDETPACVKAVGCKQFEADRDESEGGCGASSRVPGHADGAPCPSARVATPLKRGNGLPREAVKLPDKRPLIFGKDRLIHGPKKPPTKRVEAD